MSFIARSRANSELSSFSNSQRLGVWVNDLFHRYQFPSSTFNNVIDHHHHDNNNNINNNVGGHRVEIQFLGLSYLQSGPHCVSSAAFYEITETSDTLFLDEIEQPSLLLSSSSSPILSTENSGKNSSSLSAINSDNNNSNNSDMLPPKKRRRHKVIRNDVIFCIDPPPASDLHTPSPHLSYYLFPHDAVVGPVNDVPPFEIIFSFHVLDTHVEERRPTKLEEFAALCSNANRMYPRRRSTDPGSTCGNLLSSSPATSTNTFVRSGELLSNKSNDNNINTTRLMTTIPTMPVDDPQSKVVNMRISGVSRRLFVAIKQTVSEFETVCEKMVQLMTYHTQQMAGQTYSSTARTTAPRSLLSSTSPSAAVFTAHSEWEDLLNSKDNRHQHLHPRQQNYHRKNTDACSSDDANIDKDEMIIDPIPKTSQSNDANNKNSRWPTSPRSASISSSSNKNGHNNKTNSNTTNNNNGKTNNNNNTKSRSNSNGGGVKKCLYCGSKTTPMWRRGPQGAGTLCNACGVKWKHGKILQNASVTENSTSSTQSSTTTITSKERRGSLSTAHKNERKRKKSASNGSSSTSSGSGNGSKSPLDHHHYRRSSNRSASTTPAMETSSFVKPSRQNNYSDDNDDVMENNINAARNLSIREDEDEYQHHRFLSSSVPSNRVVDTFAVPWLPRDNNNNNSTRDHQQQQQQRQMIMTVATDNVSSSSHSLSGSYSPIDEPSPNSSPRLSSTASSVVNMQQQYYYHTRRHTMDISDKFEYNTDTSAFAISAGVDAVEAAAVLTLLKRS